MPSLLCLDLGTSAAKAALLDLDGTAGPQASSDYPTHAAPDGTSEQDPRDWLDAARTALVGALRGSEEMPLALSITGQMQNLVLLTDGEPAPAILYSDTRAADEACALREALRGDGLSWDRLAGYAQDATSCAAMFLRLARTDPGLVRRTRGLVFGPAGYLVHELGLGAWCDPTTASATGLLEHRTRRWSADVARAAGIAPRLLPQLVEGTGQIVGRTDAGAADLLGLPAGLPVVLALGDAGATTLGIVGLEPGDGYAYLGTSGWLATVVAGDDAPAGTSHRLALGAGASAGTLRISALLAAGAAADWAREAFLAGVSPEEADALLAQREARHGRGPTGLLALPSIHGERYPVRDGELRAAVIGMGAQTRGIDVYAAVLEGVAHAIAHAAEDGGSATSADIAEEVDGDGSARTAARPLAVVGGGASSEPWMRILADVTGRPVRTVQGADAALVGCALAAVEALRRDPEDDPGRGAGQGTGRDRGAEGRLRPLVEREGGRVVEPDASAVRGHAALHGPHRALYGAVAALRPAR